MIMGLTLNYNEKVLIWDINIMMLPEILAEDAEMMLPEILAENAEIMLPEILAEEDVKMMWQAIPEVDVNVFMNAYLRYWEMQDKTTTTTAAIETIIQ